MNTRLLRRTTSLAAVAVIAAACTGGTASTTTTTTTFVVPTTVPPTTPTTGIVELPRETGTLTVWADPAVADAVRSRAVLFTADTGVAVTVEPMAQDEILPALIESDSGGPDVFIGPHTWLLELAIAGLTEPVTIGDELPQGIVDAISLRTYALAVPLAVDALVQMRNTALVSARPTAVESIDCDGCLLLPADGSLDATYPFLVSLGGYLFGPDDANGYDTTDTEVDSPEAIAGGTVLETLVANGVVATAADTDAVLAAFTAGEAGVIWAGPEAIGVLAGEAVEALPTIGDVPAISRVRVLAAYVNARGMLKASARTFTEEYLGDPDGSRAIADATGLSPVWSATASNIELVVIEQAKTGHPVPYALDAAAAWDEVGAAFARVLAGEPAATALIDAGDAIRFATTTTTTTTTVGG